MLRLIAIISFTLLAQAQEPTGPIDTNERASVIVTATAADPSMEERKEEALTRTLFTRDDQVFQILNAGIHAGQHEGGGKSLEIRRYGFNLDHGGVSGGLKVLLDGVQQNQGTQAHGQGYLGSMKSISPELIQDITIVNGPFSAEYGDFSGLGVVHIRQRESLPQRYTLRGQGGNFASARSFVAFSPDVQRQDAYLAYENSYANGPFLTPLGYRRDNLHANYTRTLKGGRKLGVRVLGAGNRFTSSGQIPLDLVGSGQLDRFGSLDDTQGGRVKSATISAYLAQGFANGGALRIDGFVSRSLFDLYSNFTYYAANPVTGDAIQQHDSRLQEGANAQYTRVHRIAGQQANLTVGGNFHDNQIAVGLYPRQGRTATGVTTKAHAHVTNEAAYAQESISLANGRVLIGLGLRYDAFRYALVDRVTFDVTRPVYAGRWQGKATFAYTPWHDAPLTMHANYGRGINSVDARAAVYRPDQPRLGTTDFLQAGATWTVQRVSLTGDVFWIDRSNEQVYIPDDGTFELQGPSRAYGWEGKLVLAITRRLSLTGGVTKVGNAYFKTDPREYVSNAPRFVANAALTLSDWKGWSGSLRMRAINHYRLDAVDPSILAQGQTVLDLGLAKQLRRGVEWNLSIDNVANRPYFETQNYGESAIAPGAPVQARIHGTPGYPLTFAMGITLRLGGR
jgi:hypothetical protein